MSDFDRYFEIHYKDLDKTKLTKKEIKEIKKSASYIIWKADEDYTRYLKKIAKVMQDTIDDFEKKIRG